MPLCPYAKGVKGTIVYCELAGRKVSSLKYPCKGRYQACPIYRARAGRRTARRVAEEKPQPAERVEEARPSAAEERPVEAEAPAPTSRAEESLPEAPSPPPPAPVAAEPSVRESPPSAEAVKAFTVKPGRAVCDPLFQANVILNAEESRDFQGTLQEIAALSRGKKDVIVYFAGTVTASGGQIRLVAYDGVVASVQVEPSRGEPPKCGAEALDYVKPDIVVSGVLYIASLSSLGMYGDQVKREASS